jgi:ferrous iron transport protein A
MMKLKELKVGEMGMVSGFATADPAYRQKLLRMGLTRNAEFTIIRKAPFGGPIGIEIKGSQLVLRSDEADVLEVEQK